MQFRRRLMLWLSIIVSGIAAGCMSNFPTQDKTQLSPLQVRAVETRDYDGHDVKTTLKTVLNVLQDEDFLVDYGNADLGLLHARKSMQGPPVPVPGFGDQPSINTIEATVNVSEFGDHIKVRINFRGNIRSAAGKAAAATEITDIKFYQEFFAKLERGLFIQKQGL